MSRRTHTAQIPHPSSDAAIAPTIFWFVGDSLALDLVNTIGVVRGKRNDLLATPQDVAHWWDQAHVQYPALARHDGAEGVLPIDHRLLEQVKSLRTALRAIVCALIDGLPPALEDLDVLNAALRPGYRSLSLGSDGRLHCGDHADVAAHDAVLVPTALAAARLLDDGDYTRLRRCRRELCLSLFYDTTKNATRCWCSEYCRDRARSAARYQQMKQNKRGR